MSRVGSGCEMASGMAHGIWYTRYSATALATGTACSQSAGNAASTNQMRSTIIIPQHKRRDARKFTWAVLARIYPRNFKSFAYGNPTGPDEAPNQVLLARCTFGCAARTEDA